MTLESAGWYVSGLIIGYAMSASGTGRRERREAKERAAKARAEAEARLTDADRDHLALWRHRMVDEWERIGREAANRGPKPFAKWLAWFGARVKHHDPQLFDALDGMFATLPEATLRANVAIMWPTIRDEVRAAEPRGPEVATPADISELIKPGDTWVM